jgi:hypothetical protein
MGDKGHGVVVGGGGVGGWRGLRFSAQGEMWNRYAVHENEERFAVSFAGRACASTVLNPRL